ncbi:hypothetical protein SDC9_109049 [bioreactor metagenome]|uniref:Uncharacterized protein n=1 Tax=bioreactor metagenome TaxID=1076179 RepID=A0A645BG64_9ZZZZ
MLVMTGINPVLNNTSVIMIKDATGVALIIVRTGEKRTSAAALLTQNAASAAPATVPAIYPHRILNTDNATDE